MVRETRLAPEQFIYPIFVCPGEGIKKPIVSMPGQHQLSIDSAIEVLSEAQDVGVVSTILFGIPSTKDAVGSEAYAEDGIIQQTIREIK